MRRVGRGKLCCGHYFEMADGIDELGVDMGAGAGVCGLGVDDVVGAHDGVGGGVTCDLAVTGMSIEAVPTMIR
jgi:hypothetical protein